jgi:hypothetical protein
MIPGAEAIGRPFENLGKLLSDSSLKEQRIEIFNMMKNAQRTIVVLIEDLDRLDRDEILMMLKVVRHTANVPYVAYVLAFDDDMVARALDGAYGGHPNSGSEFLEKIIQLPFAIPAIGQRRLVNYVLRRLAGPRMASPGRLDSLTREHPNGRRRYCVVGERVGQRLNSLARARDGLSRSRAAQAAAQALDLHQYNQCAQGSPAGRL